MKLKKYERRSVEPLKEGEIICSRCNGNGIGRKQDKVWWEWCTKCLGSGKLDWVENIIGKHLRFPVVLDK